NETCFVEYLQLPYLDEPAILQVFHDYLSHPSLCLQYLGQQLFGQTSPESQIDALFYLNKIGKLFAQPPPLPQPFLLSLHPLAQQLVLDDELIHKLNMVDLQLIDWLILQADFGYKPIPNDFACLLLLDRLSGQLLLEQ